MTIISQRRGQARWAYNGIVFKVKVEIPVQSQPTHRFKAFLNVLGRLTLPLKE
jgi:hypothetical protein